ncbi:MAG: hypothetical protein PHI01_00495 [Candidatus Izemoplasmatales bacterium]|nr:hypothetical protein [Candidatus Izemoplasmatales bacterium]
MKKLFGSIVIILSLLLVSLVAIPWNNLSLWWGLTFPLMSDNELYIKAGIGGLMLIFSLIFLIVANKEQRKYGHVVPGTAHTAFLPMFAYAIAALVYPLVIFLFIYAADPSTTNLIYLIGVGFVLVNIIVFGHMLSAGFRRQKNFGRVMIFILLFELMAIGMGVSYYVRAILITDAWYQGLYTFLYIGIFGVTLIFAIVHLIVIKVKGKNRAAEKALEAEIDDLKSLGKPISQQPVSRKGKKGEETVVQTRPDGKKTLIVSKEQTIVSGEQNLDPTNILYEDVDVDPEFSKTQNQDKQVSSIEYYIEKPKMFKPLDPTFDQLVGYVRELPQVVTKLADEKITFYVDRKPFLVLMNYGNYYRMAFKYELEKGIRLIIKYPTISKNKSTRDDLWFKANNYGDIPKEVVYQIVKSAYDNVNA